MMPKQKKQNGFLLTFDAVDDLGTTPNEMKKIFWSQLV